jgi:hypothetical protein
MIKKYLAIIAAVIAGGLGISLMSQAAHATSHALSQN